MYKRASFVTISYILLLVVMGGRTALFVSLFDQLVVLPLGGAHITLLSILLAVALILAVSGGAWHRAHAKKGSRGWQIASFAMYGAAVADGWFNTAEAYYLANETQVFAGQPSALRIFLLVTTGLIGIAPTVLTMLLASLAGSLDAKASSSRPASRTRIGLQVEHEVSPSPILDGHWTTIRRHVQPGAHIRRLSVEQWTGLGKAQAVNVLNYGIQIGHIQELKRGVYILLDEG